MDKSTRKRASSTQSQSRPKRYVNHGQIQEKGIKYTVTIKTQKVCKPVFQLGNEKGRAPGRALCAKWAREGTF